MVQAAWKFEAIRLLQSSKCYTGKCDPPSRFSPGIFIFKNILESDPKNTFLNLEEMEVLALKILLKYSKGILCSIKPELK